MLDREGLSGVGIEEIGGRLSDHYDPRSKVLRLSSEVYPWPLRLASVGVACHESRPRTSGCKKLRSLVIRNLAVPSANFGSGTGMGLIMLGVFTGMTGLIMVGVILFTAVVAFQLVNLPVEFTTQVRVLEELWSIKV